MAQLLNQLLGTRYADALNRIFGEDVEVGSVSPELQASITLLGDRPEWRYLFDERLGGVHGAVAALAGNFSTVTYINPPGSELLVIIDAIITGGTTIWRILQNVATAAPATRTIPRDTRMWRIGVAGGTSARLQSGFTGTQSVGGSTGLEIAFMPAAHMYEHAIVLPPGTAVDVQPSAVNIGIDVSFVVRERRVRLQELVSGLG